MFGQEVGGRLPQALLAAASLCCVPTLGRSACCAPGLMQAHGAEVGKVAVLSPYKAQVAALERAFRAAHGAAALAAVEFGTVDGFQARRPPPRATRATCAAC